MNNRRIAKISAAFIVAILMFSITAFANPPTGPVRASGSSSRTGGPPTSAVIRPGRPPQPQPPRPPHPYPPRPYPPQPYPYPYYPNYYPYYPNYYPYNYAPQTYVSPDDYGFGPAATMRFMGVTPNSNNTARPASSYPNKPDAAIAELEKAKKQLEETLKNQQKAKANSQNSQDTAEAWKFIGAGDALFSAKNYDQASVRYKNAAKLLPEVTEAWVRAGMCQYAQGDYDQAITEIKNGIELNMGWVNRELAISDLYGADSALQKTHFNQLSDKLSKDPHNPELNYMMGVVQSLQGDKEKARKYFEKAVTRDRTYRVYSQPFL